MLINPPEFQNISSLFDVSSRTVLNQTQQMAYENWTCYIQHCYVQHREKSDVLMAPQHQKSPR